MKKLLLTYFSIALFISGCAPFIFKNHDIILGQINHWRLQAYMQTDEAKRYCAKEGKIPDLLFKDGWIYKCKSVDK